MKSDKYIMNCYKCESDKKLQMLGYRNDKGFMIGWIFICEKCLVNIRGKDNIINISIENNTKETESKRII